MFELTKAETIEIDERLDPVLSWAKDGRLEAQQLALDATRLLSCTESRLDRIQKQGFFRRWWSTLTGETREANQANQRDLLKMQQAAWRYIDLLQERDLMMAQAIIAIRNNLLTLAVKEEESRNEVRRLAERVYERFGTLEARVKHLECATNIHGWLLTLEARDYDDRFTPHLRLLRVLRDFHSLKPNNWTAPELRYLQQALKQVGLPLESSMSIAHFLEELMEEIEQAGFSAYERLITLQVDNDKVPAEFVFENVSAPTFLVLYEVADKYTANATAIDVLQEELHIDRKTAVTKLLLRHVRDQGIDLDKEVQLRDMAVDLLHGMQLTMDLYYVRDKGSSLPYAWRKLATNAQGRTEAILTLVGGQDMYFIQCPAGTFVMGMTVAELDNVKEYNEIGFNRQFSKLAEIYHPFADRESKATETVELTSELPQHQVTFSEPFWLAKHAVTVGQFRAFVDATGYRTDAEKKGEAFIPTEIEDCIFEKHHISYKKIAGLNWRNPGFTQSDSHPVVCVTWNDIVAFCTWVSEVTGVDVGLPNEAQWEYGCRAGTTTPFSFGETITPEQVNYNGERPSSYGKAGLCREKTVPVGSMPPNPWGLHEMHGNVEEPCEDRWHDSYHGAPLNGSARNGSEYGKDEGRVARGGHWFQVGTRCRSAARNRVFLGTTIDATRGFRLIASRRL